MDMKSKKESNINNANISIEKISLQKNDKKTEQLISEKKHQKNPERNNDYKWTNYKRKIYSIFKTWYENGKLKFEGEYLKGEKNAKVKHLLMI